MNLLHELPPGPDAGSGESDPAVIYVAVEVPKGSRNKYEYDKRQGFVKLDEGIQTEVLGWERATVAREQILNAADLYRQRLAQPAQGKRREARPED